MNTNLTVEEAYAAMFAFLDMVYERTKSDDMGGLLGDMSTLESGGTADPAVWSEWLQCVEQVKRGKVDTVLHIFPLQEDK